MLYSTFCKIKIEAGSNQSTDLSVKEGSFQASSLTTVGNLMQINTKLDFF